MNYKETDDIWRLYRREWIIVHTTDTIAADTIDPSMNDAEQWVQANLADRIRPEDIRLTADTDTHGKFWCHVEIFKDNLKGEFKYVENAQAFAALKNYQEYVIVPRNSKSDHDIRNYGVVKL